MNSLHGWFGLVLVGLTLGTPVQERAGKGKSEKELLADFQKQIGDSDPAKRVEAVKALGDGTRQLEDKGASKAVAKALVRALEDPEFEVQDAAAFQLSFGRDVDTALGGLKEHLDALYAALARTQKASDPAQRNTAERGRVHFLNGCKAMANFRDDRGVAWLAQNLGQLRADELGESLVGKLAATALDLDALDVVTAAVKQTKVFHGTQEEPHLHALFAALSEFAARHQTTPPEWSAEYAAAWQAWLEANQNKFTKKFGRQKAPPPEAPIRGMDGLPGKSG
jgi:hypothetical protein